MTAPLGILMLDTRFPRIPGDIGNPATWPFPVIIKIVPGATAAMALHDDPKALCAPFVTAGRDLVAQGCAGIATTCGFLTPLQNDLAASLGVPVATSALYQVAGVARSLPPGRVAGIVTISAATLGPEHLSAAQVPEGTPIAGVDPQGRFARMIFEDRPEIDIPAARAEVVAAARDLAARTPNLGAIVLECTNMVPYAADVQAALGLPVFSIYTHLLWFQAALQPARFAPPG